MLDKETIFRVAAEAFERAVYSPQLFERFVKEDDRVKSLPDLEIAVAFELCFILFHEWHEARENKPTAILEPRFSDAFLAAFELATTAAILDLGSLSNGVSR
jgi:hypothetical protein